MKRLGDFLSQLGPPLRDLDTEPLERVAAGWGVSFPSDLLEVLTAYGDAVVSGQIRLLGPRTLERAGVYFGPAMLPSLGEVCLPIMPFTQVRLLGDTHVRRRWHGRVFGRGRLRGR